MWGCCYFPGSSQGRVPGLGEKDVLLIFQPLLSSPKVPLAIDEGGLYLSDIEVLNPKQIERIQKKAKAKAKKNRKIAVKAMHTYESLFHFI